MISATVANHACNRNISGSVKPRLSKKSTMMGIRTRNTWKNDSTSIRWRFFSNCRRVGVDILLSLLKRRFHAVNQRKTPMAGGASGFLTGFPKGPFSTGL